MIWSLYFEGESFQHHPFGQQNPIQPRAKALRGVWPRSAGFIVVVVASDHYRIWVEVYIV